MPTRIHTALVTVMTAAITALPVYAQIQADPVVGASNGIDYSRGEQTFKQFKLDDATLSQKIKQYKAEASISDEGLKSEMGAARNKISAHLEKFKEDYQGPDKADLRSKIGVKVPSDINKGKGIDIEALSRQLSQQAALINGQQEEQQGIVPGFDIQMFVSLSMPTPTLIAIAKQAEVLGIPLVLRGLKSDSMQATTKAILEIQRKARKTSWTVNPPGFKRYRIKAVPTLVIAQKTEADRLDGEGCAPPGSYVAVVGDVSIDHALENVEKEAPKFAKVGALLRAKLIGVAN